MANKSRQIKRAETNQIEKMLFNNYTDQEIIRALNFAPSTFYRYKANIVKNYAEVFRKQRMDNIGFYTEQLRDRLTKDILVLEKKIGDCTGKDAAALMQIKLEVEKTLFDLNLQGLELLGKINDLDSTVRNKYRFDNIDNSDTNNNDDEDRLISKTESNS